MVTSVTLTQWFQDYWYYEEYC